MIILANKTGYLMLTEDKRTRYQGAYFFDNNACWKTLECVQHNEKIKETTHALWSVERESENTKEGYYLAHKGIIYENQDNKECTLILDCKRMDDNREWGRTYEISTEQQCIVVTYKKTNSNEEDNTNNDKEYEYCVAISGEQLEFLPLQNWIKHEYEYDEKRKSPPYHRWVYEALKFRTTVAIAYSFNKEEAITNAKNLLQNKEAYKKQSEEKTVQIIAKTKNLAKQCALNSIYCLTTDTAIRAGLPWFYETWSRDELISTKAIISIDKELATSILKKYATFPIANKENGKLISADAPGWLFLRWKNLMNKAGLSGAETKILRERIRLYLNSITWKDGLVFNNSNETWMDSVERNGCNIEVQALTLAAAKFLNQLGEKTIIEEELREQTRKHFWNGKWLFDEKNDQTIRPNVFLAAYAYPELLTKEEWTTCFQNTLKKLWLPWGGISSIDTTDKRFIREHTGEKPDSYHNGDSWYWINNITAIVLHNHKGFDKYVQKIYDASEKEILQMGAIGHHAELSSAKEQTSEGCPMQAWSAATFIELCDELKK
ncbi:hypothetical protein HY486_03540 [Candidatus Woesearchaeota archaeon]|nr:hypothetical protein [Candidatus Woesearchaeota archaeon]